MTVTKAPQNEQFKLWLHCETWS